MFAIEEIYDAAFDRARFPILIERLCKAFGAQAGFIGWSDTDRDAGFQTQFGNDPQWLRSYVETYAPHDILRPHLHAMEEGVSGTAWPLLQDPQVRQSIFYREYLAPQGIVDNLAVNLIKRPGIMGHFALLRCEPAEPFSDADCARLNALVPHLRRAIYIQSHVVRAADHAASDRAFADSASSASVLLAADRTVLDAEASLVQPLRLRIGEPLGDGLFGSAAVRAVESGQPVAIQLPGDEQGEGARLLIEARALEMDRFGDLVGGPGATHAIHVTRVDRPREIAYAAIGSLYSLTATELRVLRDAIEMSDLTGIGDRLGMARATARTHLHRIYEKTATGSFASLSNLAHRFGRIGPA